MFQWLKNLVSFSDGDGVPNWWRMFPTNPVSSGVVVNKNTAMGIAPLMNALRLVSNTIARCDVNVWAGADDNQLAADHPAYKLLAISPNPYQTPFCWKKQMVFNAILFGNAYSFYDATENETYILDSDSVTPTVVYRDGIKAELVYSVHINGQQFVLRADEVIHLRGNAQAGNGLVGLSLLDQAREALGLAIAQTQFASVFYSNGASFGTVIEVPAKFKTQEEQEAFRRQFDQTQAGITNAHKVAIVSVGTKITRFTLNAEETQLLAMNPHIITTMANLVGIPPHKIGGVQATSYSSILAENEAMFGDCYDAILSNYEQELEAKLLSEKEKQSQLIDIDFNRYSLRAGDIDGETNRIVNLYNSGLYTIQEARTALGKPAEIPEGQELKSGPAVTNPTPEPPQQQTTTPEPEPTDEVAE